MIKNFATATAMALILSAPAYGQERTFVTNPPTVSGSGVTYNSGTNTVTATAADGARLYTITRPIEASAKYKYEFTVSGYTAGGVQPYVGTIRDTYAAPTKAVVNSPATTPLSSGLVPIADNFTTADGLEVSPSVAPDGDPAAPINDGVGAFRFVCGTSHIASVDPMVVPNLPGASHMHNFFGNNGTNAYSTYKSLRTTGGSSCQGSQNAPINRTSYWFPAMLNGRGGIVTAGDINVYYKRHPVASPYCQAGVSKVGDCVTFPTGLQMIWGYNMTTMTASGNVNWKCRAKLGMQTLDGGNPAILGRGPSAGGAGDVGYATLQALRTAGTCPSNAAIVVDTEAPVCWNGTQVATSDHRAHVSYLDSGTGKCPATHPYLFATVRLQIYWAVDANLNNWRLSSDDQMGMGVAAGETFHTDLWEAWSPAYKTEWHLRCINEYRSCSNGQNGTGLAFKGAFPVRVTRVVPMTRLGLGVQRKKNGTFTGEFTAPANGEFGFNFLLFTGNITGFKVTKITKGARGPVTIGVTQ